jgi:hypothetical protein
LIDDTLATAITTATGKSGYYFTYTSATPFTTYTNLGLPTAAGTTGQRGFFTDQTGVIRYAISGTPTVASSPIS